MLDWIQHHDLILWWLAAGSVVTFGATLLLVPWLIIHLPADYFSRQQRRPPLWADYHPVLRIILVSAKNLLGTLLLVLGGILLLLPGQGLLTIVLGLVLLDFPGKFKLQRGLVSQTPVLKAINRLRRRAKRPPLKL